MLPVMEPWEALHWDSDTTGISTSCSVWGKGRGSGQENRLLTGSDSALLVDWFQALMGTGGCFSEYMMKLGELVGLGELFYCWMTFTRKS